MRAVGGFESWAHTLGGILLHADVPGFLENLDGLYDQMDEEAGEWETFLVALEGVYGDAEIQVADLARDIYDAKGDLRDALPSDLASSLDRSHDKPSAGFKVSLGRALAKREGTRYGPRELHLELARTESRGRRPVWRVRAGVQGSQGSDQSSPGKDAPDDIPF